MGRRLTPPSRLNKMPSYESLGRGASFVENHFVYYFPMPFSKRCRRSLAGRAQSATEDYDEDRAWADNYYGYSLGRW